MNLLNTSPPPPPEQNSWVRHWTNANKLGNVLITKQSWSAGLSLLTSNDSKVFIWQVFSYSIPFLFGTHPGAVLVGSDRHWNVPVGLNESIIRFMSCTSIQHVTYGQTDTRGVAKYTSAAKAPSMVVLRSAVAAAGHTDDSWMCVCVCVRACSAHSVAEQPVDALCLLQPIAKRLKRFAPPATNLQQHFP